eukprot:CAMPEP_0172443470 /NCGR_PEP_ID=MMETSP1065-20121228/3733_1 /TAXON_ID=265537 /ORGANISM="Amphiprora paludosa, Strain CCMP125" /LENGTH=251 /DNA_ID=CAMNT_0013193721 /DNA_START=23 /DNA_END=778 /DNA_ORIENTATION=+
MVSASFVTLAALVLSSPSAVGAFSAAPSNTQSTTRNVALFSSSNNNEDNQGLTNSWRTVAQATALGLTMATASLLFPQAALADGQTKDFRLPPIDYADKSRCELKSSSIGQANAARDKLYDLRMCDLKGAQAGGFDLSGVIMSNTNLAGAKLEEAYFSKGYMRESNFEGTDFTNAIIDRASFKGSSLRGAIFKNTVLTGTSFEDADVEGADFTEAALGSFDIRGLCKNPTLKGENPTTGADTRETVGCGPS